MAGQGLQGAEMRHWARRGIPGAHANRSRCKSWAGGHSPSRTQGNPFSAPFRLSATHIRALFRSNNINDNNILLLLLASTWLLCDTSANTPSGSRDLSHNMISTARASSDKPLTQHPPAHRHRTVFGFSGGCIMRRRGLPPWMFLGMPCPSQRAPVPPNTPNGPRPAPSAFSRPVCSAVSRLHPRTSVYTPRLRRSLPPTPLHRFLRNRDPTPKHSILDTTLYPPTASAVRIASAFIVPITPS